MTFPQLDLPPRQHARARATLVQEAGRRRRPRFVVPMAAAVAVVAVIATGVVVAERLRERPTPATPPAKAQCNDTRPGTRADAEGLTYVLDVPAGWTAKATVDQVLYCAGAVPEAFYSGSATGFRIFRGLTTRVLAATGVLPPNITEQNRFPLVHSEQGANIDMPYETVDVGGTPGRLFRGNTIAWEADGQWWTIAAGDIRAARLRQIAAQLEISGDRVTWPQARENGFSRSEEEPAPDLEEGSWQPQWNLCLREQPGSSGPCSIAYRAARWSLGMTGNEDYPPFKAIQDANPSSGGGGWTTPQGVVVSHWFASDEAVYRKTPGTQHLVPLDSPEVTALLG